MHKFNFFLFIAFFAILTPAQAQDGVRQVVKLSETGPQMLKSDQFRPFENGFEKDGDAIFVCTNVPGEPIKPRGVSQYVALNQKTPRPILASAWSRAENVSGSPDSNYSVYLDLAYEDGTNLWGQTTPFNTGNADWHKKEVVVFPEKPVRSLTFHMLFREHTGKAFFKDMQLREVEISDESIMFDAVPTLPDAKSRTEPTFWIRDVAAKGDFRDTAKFPQGLKIQRKQISESIFEYEISSDTGKDRALTILYTIPIPRQGLRYCEDARTTIPVEPGREYSKTTTSKIGVNGRLSKYPFLAVAQNEKGTALGIDMAFPFYFRTGYNSDTQELFLAGDIALTKEKPSAVIRICRFEFDGKQEFRGALAAYHKLFPEAFRVRVSKQGVWMPFAKISEVEGWEDFGFYFKEGNNETRWDDEHDILTFRYTEPLTWWMSMPKDMPRTMDAAVKEAQRLAQTGNRYAQAFASSGYRDQKGDFCGIFLDTPWTNGVVWSMNDTPGIPTQENKPNGFAVKWNPNDFQSLYGPDKKADLDGEYIDSAECYVTAEIDFDRSHFAASRHPLVFSLDTLTPGVFKGLNVQEYIEGIAKDVHGAGKLMMANSTPHRLCWLLPLVDVAGTETNWNYNNAWRPMQDEEMLYIRSLCGGKPFCFLMNTDFTKFTYEMSEKFMKRSLAYGMFPGYFSADASTGHYFSQPALYNRDRPLFKKYVPLCKLVAEAGWEPTTGAKTDAEKVYLERFGNGPKTYWTVFNDSGEEKTVKITFDESGPKQLRELVRNETLSVDSNSVTIKLGPEDVAVLHHKP